MRQFDSGATRDDDTTKPVYTGFLSPLVILRFGEYMNRHRVQSDGKLRDADNWKKGFGEHNAQVCLESLGRHFLDFWLAMEGYPELARDNIEEILCAIIFNAQGALHGIMKDKLNEGAWIRQEMGEKAYALKNGLLPYEREVDTT